MEWEDITSYSRSEKERIAKIWELRAEGLRIVIHRIIHCEGWYLSVRDLNIDDYTLGTDDLKEAKNRGLEIVIERIIKLKGIADILVSIIS